MLTEEKTKKKKSSSKRRQKILICYITCKDKAEARLIAKSLLKKNLISCANIFPVSSLYVWKGKFCDAKEYALIVKSQRKLCKNIEAEIRSIHSYEVPCILSLDVGSNADFALWVKSQVL